uniref:Uncharacterized protein n=1 Tax=Favella ehrenbergii TaxID=182087 RepID=A0A7S3MMR9_9SPIT|mmetsp:Transcript_28495/g.35176  ORF Transcript_28495/g.35176 Transcript_28495/m.35176 type:complete len:163 (+) Transcript_28495:56-544(+)
MGKDDKKCMSPWTIGTAVLTAIYLIFAIILIVVKFVPLFVLYAIGVLLFGLVLCLRRSACLRVFACVVMTLGQIVALLILIIIALITYVISAAADDTSVEGDADAAAAIMTVIVIVQIMLTILTTVVLCGGHYEQKKFKARGLDSNGNPADMEVKTGTVEKE